MANNNPLTVPAAAPSPYGRSKELGSLQALHGKNDAARAQAFSDYRGAQIGAIETVLGQTRQLGELFGGMQTGDLLEMYLNSGALGKGVPTGASLTGGFTGQRDALALGALARQGQRGGGGDGDNDFGYVFTDEAGNYFSFPKADDPFKMGLDELAPVANPQSLPPGTVIREGTSGGTFTIGGNTSGRTTRRSTIENLGGSIVDNGDGTSTVTMPNGATGRFSNEELG